MEYRSVTLRDLDAFLEMRMEFVQSIRKLADEAQFRRDTEAYLAAHMEQDDFSAFVAEENGRLAACCMVSFYQTAPRPRCPSGRYAELLNVYT
ncbi:MAG: GNAT family N-acetyltransferase, partial [Clostridia bacterium]|nr:GNAT family N-acetyltransferase [Clostridia bacterium]